MHLEPAHSATKRCLSRGATVPAVHFAPQALENRLAFTAQQLEMIHCGLDPSVWCVLTRKMTVIGKFARVPFLQGKRVLL